MDIVDEVLEKLKITVYTIEFYVNFKLVNLNLATISYSFVCVPAERRNWRARKRSSAKEHIRKRPIQFELT